MDKEIPHCKKPGGTNLYLNPRISNNFLISPTSPNEIIDLIDSLDDSKSPGPCVIPTKLLKIAKQQLSIPLSAICNSSFEEGVFPELAKVAKVIPLHKKGSTFDVNNYRPISLLSIFSKILEKLMITRLNTFLDLHDIIHPNQFGFRSGYSTAHSLISITETIRQTLDNNKFGCGVFIDLKKAFDTVNHKILLSKLNHYGIREEALSWFESYLTNRSQYVHLNGLNSDNRNIICGVPQGSVLGPILFLLYINDLPNISSKLKFYLFADDTNIYLESNDLRTLEKTMNKELLKLYEWLCINRLSLNISKTNFVIFHPNIKPINSVTILINNKAINEEQYVKYLGILIDSQLTFKFHIDELNKKISRAIGVLYKLRPFVTPDILCSVYYAIIYPFLMYGILIWGNANITLVNPIHILQKKFVRMASYNDGYPTVPGPLVHTPPLFRKFGLLTIFDIFKFQLGKLIFESINKFGPTNNVIKFINASDIHSHNTRYASQGNFYTNSIRTTRFGLKGLQFEGKRLWYTLPGDVKRCKTVRSFKNNFKRLMVNSYANAN